MPVCSGSVLHRLHSCPVLSTHIASLLRIRRITTRNLSYWRTLVNRTQSPNLYIGVSEPLVGCASFSPLLSQRRGYVDKPENWKEHAHHDATAVVQAATVLLIRDGTDGLETLLLRKNAKITFGGMWVYPGGKVDEGDRIGLASDDDLSAARRAAVREAAEETGLKVDIDVMLPFAHWRPPTKVLPKVFLTWFLMAPAPEGAHVKIDDGEILEHAWMSPQTAIDKRNRGEMQLAPPTYVSLLDMRKWRTVKEAMTAVRQRKPEHYRTQFSKVPLNPKGQGLGTSDDKEEVKQSQVVLMWHGDEFYTPRNGVVGARHRLTMSDEWLYERNNLADES